MILKIALFFAKIFEIPTHFPKQIYIFKCKNVQVYLNGIKLVVFLFHEPKVKKVKIKYL